MTQPAWLLSLSLGNNTAGPAVLGHLAVHGCATPPERPLHYAGLSLATKPVQLQLWLVLRC